MRNLAAVPRILMRKARETRREEAEWNGGGVEFSGSKTPFCLGILFTGNCIPVIPGGGFDVWKKWLVPVIMGTSRPVEV
jgi:hypothetical protein